MPHFAPGNRSYAKRLINYNVLYNQLNSNSLNRNLSWNNTDCQCKTNSYNKTTVHTSSPSYKAPKNINISKIVNTYLGGKVQYGNFYLNQPMNVNYFGRVEGMPGGFGSPPLNKF
jgi:hypothetical protein